MLSACCQLMNGVLVDNFGLDLEGRNFVILFSVKEDVVHAKAPRVQLLLVPGVYEL